MNIKRFLDFLLSPFVRGSSVVMREGDFAVKISRPKTFVRFLYLIFYGRTWSPYEFEWGMKRALLLRVVANRITAFRLGWPVFVEPISVRTEWIGGVSYPALVMGWVEAEFVTPKDAIDFSKQLAEILLNAGLPTWSVVKPRTWEDMRKVGGRIRCLDYESVLPNLFVSIVELISAFRARVLVPFDRVDFKKLWLEYAKLVFSGYPHFEELELAINDLERTEWRIE